MAAVAVVAALPSVLLTAVALWAVMLVCLGLLARSVPESVDAVVIILAVVELGTQVAVITAVAVSAAELASAAALGLVAVVG